MLQTYVYQRCICSEFLEARLAGIVLSQRRAQETSSRVAREAMFHFHQSTLKDVCCMRYVLRWRLLVNASKMHHKYARCKLQTCTIFLACSTHAPRCMLQGGCNVPMFHSARSFEANLDRVLWGQQSVEGDTLMVLLHAALSQNPLCCLQYLGSGAVVISQLKRVAACMGTIHNQCTSKAPSAPHAPDMCSIVLPHRQPARLDSQ